MTTEEKIKASIAGRQHAQTVLDLAADTGPVGVNSAFWVSFWRTIRDEAEKSLVSLGFTEPEPTRASKPMDDQEARRFEKAKIPFGRHGGFTIDEIMREEPQYLDWLCRATEEDTFKADLRRYLARPDIQTLLPD